MTQNTIQFDLLQLAIAETPAIIAAFRALWKKANPSAPDPTDEQVFSAFEEAFTSSLEKDEQWLAHHPGDVGQASTAGLTNDQITANRQSALRSNQKTNLNDPGVRDFSRPGGSALSNDPENYRDSTNPRGLRDPDHPMSGPGPNAPATGPAQTTGAPPNPATSKTNPVSKTIK